MNIVAIERVGTGVWWWSLDDDVGVLVIVLYIVLI